MRQIHNRHLAALALFVLAACGDDGATSSNETTTLSSTGVGGHGEGGQGLGGHGAGGQAEGGQAEGGQAVGGQGAGGEGASTSGGGGGGGAPPECDPPAVECDGECVPDALSCGVAIPTTCATPDACGVAATCIDERCVCAAGFRACAMGCCPVEYSTEASMAGVVAEDIRLAYAPDGTAYLALAVTDEATDQRNLQLYSHEGGVIAQTSLTLPNIARAERAFDLAVRDDGVVFIAYGQYGGSVRLAQWSPGQSPTEEDLGGYNANQPGVSIDIADNGDVWVSYDSPQNTNQVRGFRLTLDGTRQTFSRSTTGSLAQSTVRVRPTTGGVYAFWGHRYTGNFVSGTAVFTDTPALDPTCPVDDARFDGDGHIWSVFNSYSSIRTHVCRDGVSVRLDQTPVHPGFPDTLNQARISVDAEAVAHLVAYEAVAYKAHWFASGDGVAWSRTELPIVYGNPQGSNQAGPAHVATATSTSGRAALAIVPGLAGMGPLRLFEIE